MSCNGSKKFLTFISLNNLFHLNFLDKMTLNQIENHTFNELNFFSKKKSIDDIGFIIKLANASPTFTKICKKPIYNEIWNDLYSILGLFVPSHEAKRVAFYTHLNTDSFDLLRGLYFFYCSQNVRTAVSDEFSNSEIRFLKEAIRYKSVHAVQMYNTFIYNKITNGKLEEGEDAKTLLVDAIKNSKSLLQLHGSYAYMLLAEAFFRYAVWEKNNDEIPTAQRALKSAIIACDNAAKYLYTSRFSIYNASFGKGLGYSNSFGISSPEEAKIMLEDFLKEISNHHTVTPVV